MIFAKIIVSGVRAVPGEREPIPAGLIGGQLEFSFTDPTWDGLTKTVVFQGYGTKDITLDGDIVVIPAEVVSRKGVRLRVGVHGTDTQQVIAIPTLWADLGEVRDAADPSSDPAADPSLPIWAELTERVDALEQSGSTGGGLSISSDGEGNVTIAASGYTSITSDGAGNVVIA